MKCFFSNVIFIFSIKKSGKNVLIAAHGNSIRALVKYLDKVPDEEIVELNIPTGKLSINWMKL